MARTDGVTHDRANVFVPKISPPEASDIRKWRGGMTTTLTIPTLTTERLTLRAPRLSDLDAYAAFRASKRASFVGGPYKRHQSFDQLCAIVGQWQMRGYGRWMVADRDTDEPLGIVGLFHPEDWPEREIAWSVFEAGEGRSIAYEAAMAARSYAYTEAQWTTAISLIDAQNTRSVALAERLGATLERPYDHPEFGRMDIWRHLGPEVAQ